MVNVVFVLLLIYTTLAAIGVTICIIGGTVTIIRNKHRRKI